MENKKTKYLLALMLMLVWGLVGYRVYDKYFSRAKTPARIAQPIYEETNNPQTDSFDLLLTYSDPFIYDDIQREEKSNNIYSGMNMSLRYPSVSVEPPRVEVRPMPIAPPPPIIFPDILYKGNINLKSGRVVALVNVAGTITNWGLNETFKDMLLAGIYEDSIRVQYKNESRTILKVR